MLFFSFFIATIVPLILLFSAGAILVDMVKSKNMPKKTRIVASSASVCTFVVIAYAAYINLQRCIVSAAR